jgi:hypothetical protein
VGAVNPFDYVKDILQGKKNLIVDDLSEKDYQPFLTNRSLSYHHDCVYVANEMNRNHFLDKKLQNDFLINIVRSKKRTYAKWIKSEKSDDIECIKQTYALSEAKARDALRLLSNEQIQKLKEQTLKGGLGK